MSTTEAEAAPATPPAPTRPPFQCPRCKSPLGPEQEWCLNCGTAARTAIAATPNWKLPVAVLAVVVVVFAIAVSWAFVELTNNDADVRAATQAGQVGAQSSGEPAPGG